ncbi:MAG: Crp/Fnr family transcriptional regulator [Bdellovibrionaceae bacterium]|nr:Crp/Fnr family transcriptional regulator [Pseudobdellovibrionaceae bacterium]
MSGILLISKSDLFVDCARSQISEKLPSQKSVIVQSPTDISAKMLNQNFDLILSDSRSIPIKHQTMKLFEDAAKTKSFIFCENFGDISPEFRDQDHVHIINCPFVSETLSTNLSKAVDEKMPWNDFLWGKGIQEVHLRAKEILFPAGAHESAVYLVKFGRLKRILSDGTPVDESIGNGQIIGELTYFERKPKPWCVIATEDCQLVRISYNVVDREISNLPPWVKAMFATLASRALKYSKAE